MSRGRAGKAPGGARVKRTREPPAPYVGPPPMGAAAAADVVDGGGLRGAPSPAGRSAPRRGRLATMPVPPSHQLSQRARSAVTPPPAPAVVDEPIAPPALVAAAAAARPREGRTRSTVGRRSSLPVPSLSTSPPAASTRGNPAPPGSALPPPPDAPRGRQPAAPLLADMATYLPYDDAGKRTRVSHGHVKDMSRVDKNAFISASTETFFMRHKPAGETWFVGPWSAAEHQQFVDHVLAVGLGKGTSYAWGAFAQGFPTRTGIQCKEYYQKLVSAGWIIDYNYARDEKGRIHYAPEGNPGDADFAGLEQLRRPPTTSASGDDEPTREGGEAAVGGGGPAVDERGEAATDAPAAATAVGAMDGPPATVQSDAGNGGDGNAAGLAAAAAPAAAVPVAAASVAAAGGGHGRAPAAAAERLSRKRQRPVRLSGDGAPRSPPRKRPKPGAAAATRGVPAAGRSARGAAAAGSRGGGKVPPRRSGRPRRAPARPGSEGDSDGGRDGRRPAPPDPTGGHGAAGEAGGGGCGRPCGGGASGRR